MERANETKLRTAKIAHWLRIQLVFGSGLVPTSIGEPATLLTRLKSFVVLQSLQVGATVQYRTLQQTTVASS
jgi:hypothetical protein